MFVEDVESGLRLFDSNELLCSLGQRVSLSVARFAGNSEPTHPEHILRPDMRWWRHSGQPEPRVSRQDAVQSRRSLKTSESVLEIRICLRKPDDCSL